MKSIKLTLAVLLFSSFIAKAQTYEVTFQVDVSYENLDGNDVFLAGTFNDWCDNCMAMTDIGNGQYQQTLSIQNGSSHLYKFIIGGWDINPEVFEEGDPCTITTDFPNRTTPIIESDLILDLVCFNSCDACEIIDPDAGCTDANAQNYNEAATNDDGSCAYLVTFQVDLSQSSYTEGDLVYVAGDFNEWCGDCNALSDDDLDEIWTATETLTNGSNQFKYTINGWDGTVEEFNGDELCVLQNGDNINRAINVSADGATEAYCFNECLECQDQVPVLILFNVDMNNQVVSDEGVHIVGDFNDWDETATQLSDIGGGIYQAGVFMLENEQSAYKYLNGPDFAFEETVPQECGVDNGFGGYNRAYTAGNGTESLDPVCFNECNECTIIPMIDLTFNLDLGPEMASPEGVHLTGSFNNFDPASMTMNNIGDGFYELTVQVPSNSSITYKFINGNDFAQSETVPFECGVDDGFGGFNRNFNTSSIDVNLGVVCFSSCVECIVENVDEMLIDLVMYPNPIRVGQKLQLSENLKIHQVSINNFLGQEHKLRYDSGIVIPQLAPGIYTLQIEYDGGKISKKIQIKN